MAEKDQSSAFTDNAIRNEPDSFSASNTKYKDKSISSSYNGLGQLSPEESLVGNPGDAFVWDQVYEPVTKSTSPALPMVSSLQQTPGLQNTGRFTGSSGSRGTLPFDFRWTGQHNDEQSNNTYGHTDWNALLDITKQLSGDPTSAYDGNFHAGGRHIVRRIKLTMRAELWLVRIPMIPCPAVLESDSRWWTNERQYTMESEIATMKFISQTTDIPVPRVFTYNTGLEGNPVGLPYLIMECIEGNMLFDLGGPSILTKEQNTKLRKSIASIQCKLAHAAPNKLGSLILKPSGNIDIGPLPAQFGFEGPFDSMVDYFLAWATHNTSFKNLHQLNDPNLIRAVESFPHRLKRAVEMLIPATSSHGYPIVHPDFLWHNILLNDSYEIVGIIDWEFAHTAPIEVFAARMNMYGLFNSRLATQDFDEEGRQYIRDVAGAEIEMNVSQQLSEAFGSIFGDLGLCMQFYEEGRALLFDNVLDRAVNLWQTQEH